MLSSFAVDSRLVGRRLDQLVLRPKQGARGRPLLVLLHGAGADPSMYLDPTLFRALRRLRERAPIVVLANGGPTSYFHDRRGERWGSYILDEVIPQAAERYGADAKRVAIGGISMGGFGALHLGRIAPDRFCAVGGHSPALWRLHYEAPRAAFDDAADFARHDLLSLVPNGRAAPYGRAPVWIDVGRQDPFLGTATAYAARVRARGQEVELRVWPGGHDSAYWRRHLGAYLRFYADALAGC